MSGILDLLNGPMGKMLVDGASKQLGMDEGTAGSAIQAAMPLILGAMKNNAASPEGAEGLLNALNKHDGGILDNLGSILGGDNIDDNILEDGSKILGHVFNGKEENVAAAVSKSSGIDMGQAMNILKVAGPILMGFLGKETRQKKVSNPNEINDVLGGLLGGESQKSQSIINQLLDADGDGSIIDDVAGMLLSGSGSKKGGLGSLLGGLFGGK